MVPFATFTVALLVCLLARAILLRMLDRAITDKVSFAFVLLNAVRIPSLLWCLAAALAIAGLHIRSRIGSCPASQSIRVHRSYWLR